MFIQLNFALPLYMTHMYRKNNHDLVFVVSSLARSGEKVEFDTGFARIVK